MLRVIAAFVVIAAAVATGAFFATRQFLLEDEAPAVAQPPPPTPTPSIEELKRREAEIEQARQEDLAKPRFYGELGDFLIIPPSNELPPDPANFVPCTTFSFIAAAVPPDHELFFTLPQGIGENTAAMMAAACPDDGQIMWLLRDGFTKEGGFVVTRGYFTSTKTFLQLDAPRDRLELTAVGDRPALIEHPMPIAGGGLKIHIIERMPGDGQPGIYLDIAGILDLATTTDIASQILQQYGAR